MGSEPLQFIIDVAWIADYGVGAKDIDADHGRLFRMLGQMRMAYGAGQEKACRALIGKFAGEIPAHFAREEAIFSKLPYPGAERHRAQHAVLALRVAAISEAAAGSAPLARPALADLIDGLAVVMMTDYFALDLELRQYFP
jgi:hemerythrin-like metal-binding protein